MRIYIFDTTLRDGQQSPGAGMSFKDNLHYAELAERVGIDVLEAGFPAASDADFAIVHTIAEQRASTACAMKIAALCQLREAQIETTMRSLEPLLAASRARVHTYVPIDPNLMQASLGKLANDKNQILHDVHRLIAMAVQQGFEVEFSPEGYSRMADNFDFVTDVIRAAVSAGASVINCPDTIGGASRWQGQDYFVNHMQQHAKIIDNEFADSKITWSVHCHNDFGLALDNSLNAVLMGPARQIEGCINGIGERAGNVALEQCILFIDRFGKLDDGREFFTHIALEHLKAISDFVAKKMLPRQPHFPIVGDNAARHSSGGHTNAILNNPLAYQPFDPKSIGSEVSFIFGPLSGSNHARAVIQQYGYRCDNGEKAEIAQFIKNFYHTRRKGITDDELIQAYIAFRAPIKISEMHQDNQSKRLQLIGTVFNKTDITLACSTPQQVIQGLLDLASEHLPELTLLDCEMPRQDMARVSIKIAKRKPLHAEATADSSEQACCQALITVLNNAYVDYHFKQENKSHGA